jgi:hypothetical protein
MASASTVRSRPVRHALAHAGTATRPSPPAITARSTEGAMARDEASYTSPVSASTGTASRWPARTPRTVPAAAGQRLAHVGPDGLGRGEADGLEDADAACCRADARGDHIADDEHRHDQPQGAERDEERYVPWG